LDRADHYVVAVAGQENIAFRSVPRRERRLQHISQLAEQRAFDIAEFCRRYGLGRTRAYEEIASGRLRVRKCGRKTLIALDDAEQWLANLPSVRG
jgi:hypothetical protein